MTEPGTSFTVADVGPEPYAITPMLTARIAVSVPGDQPVHAIALRCQVRIDPLRRGYSDDEAAGVTDLFGPRERWATTQHTFLWQHCAAMVPGFTGTTEVPLPLECTYDFEVTAAKYLHALRDGLVPLQFLFSGTIFMAGQQGFSVQLVKQHYPSSGWVRLGHDTVAALNAYKSARGLLGLDDAVTELLAQAHEEAR
jgi:hypothetical protein